MADLVLPKGLETIGSHAFFECPITIVTIPEDMQNIDERAFSGCHTLTAVTF
ncbi:MAG: leucine-rich repeat domain-containing protein, partial [Proteobacteria bacterium]|nr:leucine-rich repeat domain-containing protein [Pseudomonadota bacterium]